LASYNSDPGYGHYSFNLLSPIDSVGLSRFVPQISELASRGQLVAAYNFLGLGILSLLVLNLRSIFFGFPVLFRPSILPLVLACLVFTALATSTLVTIGPYTIVDLQLPERFNDVLAVFRISARLFWPVGCLIMWVSIYMTWHNYGPRWA